MKHLFIKTALLLGAAAAAGCGNMKQIKHQPYPETVRGETLTLAQFAALSDVLGK